MVNNITPTLFRAMIIFALMSVVSIVVVSASYIYMDDAYQDQQSSRRAMRLWKIKIDNSVEKNQIIDEFENNFLMLVNQGVVGEENRLSWFETIQNTAKNRGMPSVKYSISAQKPLKGNNLSARYQGIDVFKSVMTLNIKMAHEGDLFALLNDLEKADGLFAVDSCDIEKISKKGVGTENNMKAFCELGWYTFRGSKTKAVPGGSLNKS
ncbi:MAG TPA: hypothetical protein ENJ87_03365 [Gammaproteobacteria bacterium]|nr:hypothetical protein [Gammaproteobacteria bacterium]